MDDAKRLVNILNMSRYDWIKYNWVNVQAVAEENPVYLCAGLRPIEDRKMAADQFDALNKNMAVGIEKE